MHAHRINCARFYTNCFLAVQLQAEPTAETQHLRVPVHVSLPLQE
jgi:hypothetical protein